MSSRSNSSARVMGIELMSLSISIACKASIIDNGIQRKVREMEFYEKDTWQHSHSTNKWKLCCIAGKRFTDAQSN